MVTIGEEMTNAQSGERFVWRASRDSTNGAFCEFDLYLARNAKVAASHRHPRQEERFTVVTGQFKLPAGTTHEVIQSGGVGVIPPGIAHPGSTPPASRPT